MLQQEEVASEDMEAEVQDACLVSLATHLDAAPPLVAEDEEGKVTTHMLAARDMKILSFAKFVAKEITLLLIVRHRFDESYVSEQKMVAHASTSSYQVDPNWYADIGATDHITGELEKLAIRNKYQGGDQIRMASGTSMDISHISHTTFDTPNRPILLNNILYVPRPGNFLCLFTVLLLIILSMLSFTHFYF
jgi:hypothetical protein